MGPLEFTGLLFGVAVAAGFLGALTGLGGGVIMTPALTLLFGVDLRYAIGATLVSVIATSSGAASAYVREGYTNVRIAVFLEVATALGAVCGAFFAARVSTSALGVIFGLVLLQSAWFSTRGRLTARSAPVSDPLAVRLRLDGAYPTPEGPRSYHVRRVGAGFGLMFGAGTLSGLLGIGSGALKVIAMDRAMCIPFKVSTTTSNFMIGVTAAASAARLPESRIYQPGARHAGHARSARRLAGWCAGVGRRQRARAAHYLWCAGGRDRHPNDCQRSAGQNLTDQRMERLIGGLLRGGVVLAAAVTLVGGFWHLAQSNAAPEYRIFHGQPAELRSLAGVLHGIMQGHSEAMIQLGLLLLIATPVARVALSLAAFAAQRDWTYVAITLIVLVVLVASLSGLTL